MVSDIANSTEREADVTGKPVLPVESEKSPKRERLPRSPVDVSSPIVLSARENNIGFIRLLAATLVIFSHSPEMIDGNRFHEPLTRLFGTLSFGEFGVDIFFLISGYLITKSYLSSGKSGYLARRIGRIYPGYLVAYAVSVLIVGPMAGVALSSLHGADYLKLLGHALWLDMPPLKNAFMTEHYPLINGAMWTISYEFRCYLLVMLFGALGFYKKRVIPVCLSLIFLFLYLFVASDFRPSSTSLAGLKEVATGNLVHLTRFMLIFTCGSLFYLFRDKIKYTGSAAFLCVLSLLVFMFSGKLAEPALCSLGAYALFYFAFQAKRFNINSRYDISYGVYLYAWPLAALILLYYPAVTQVCLSVLTFVLAAIAGAISWLLIERPAMRLAHYSPKRVPRNRLGAQTEGIPV